jgi:folylpolyglutamate synthase/dihydropteroate synthase
MITALDVDKTVFVEDSIPLALDHAKRIAKQNDLICVTGSLFTVGEARGYVLHTKTDF